MGIPVFYFSKVSQFAKFLFFSAATSNDIQRNRGKELLSCYFTMVFNSFFNYLLISSLFVRRQNIVSNREYGVWCNLSEVICHLRLLFLPYRVGSNIYSVLLIAITYLNRYNFMQMIKIPVISFIVGMKYSCFIVNGNINNEQSANLM